VNSEIRYAKAGSIDPIFPWCAVATTAVLVYALGLEFMADAELASKT